MNTHRGFTGIVCIVIICSSAAYSQTNQNPKLHTPAEILKIMEDSRITYEISSDFDTTSVVDTPVVLSDRFFLKESKRGYSLIVVDLPEGAQRILDSAEAAFRKDNFSEAIGLYWKVYQEDPDYHHALVFIGDAYYNEGHYDSAIVYFKRAIDSNFVDYDAHWFLADAYWKLSLPDSAIREITIAHLLNVYHKNLNKRLRFYRDKIGRPWKEWSYRPLYEISKNGNVVSIKSTPRWITYAMVKALWKYEPGYCESLIGKKNDSLIINWPEEKEAVIAYLSDSTKNQQLNQIIEAGYFDEFVFYELAARRAPATMLLLPRDEFFRVVDYVDRFH